MCSRKLSGCNCVWETKRSSERGRRQEKWGVHKQQDRVRERGVFKVSREGQSVSFPLSPEQG